MLVLTRKLQETIKIGDEVTIHILRVKGSTVRLGIDAPREIRVIRGELADKESAVDEASSATAPLVSGDTREVKEEASAVDGDSQRPRAALSNFFPRVPKTVHFPLTTFEPNQGPLSSS